MAVADVLRAQVVALRTGNGPRRPGAAEDLSLPPPEAWIGATVAARPPGVKRGPCLILPDDAFFAFMRPDIRGGWMGSINALYGIDMLISCQDDGRLWLRRTFDSIGGSDVAFAAIGDSTVIKHYGDAAYLLLFQRGDIVVQMDAQGTDVRPEALESLAAIAAAIDDTLPR